MGDMVFPTRGKRVLCVLLGQGDASVPTFLLSAPLTPKYSFRSPRKGARTRLQWRAPACHPVLLLVILSEAKDLTRWVPRSFASLRMTLGGRFFSPHLKSRWCNMLESMLSAPAPTRLGVY